MAERFGFSNFKDLFYKIRYGGIDDPDVLIKKYTELMEYYANNERYQEAAFFRDLKNFLNEEREILMAEAQILNKRDGKTTNQGKTT